jgi:hypothetical protein
LHCSHELALGKVKCSKLEGEMKRRLWISMMLAMSCLAVVTTVGAAITTPAGAVPTGLPARMVVGLFEGPGETWMRDSGVPWDVRYAYFTKGWANNWGWGAYDGAFASSYFTDCDNLRTIPAIQYYQMNGEAGGAENAFYAKTQNASTMASYFGDFKLLMQRAKAFNKPVIVMVEADGFAFLEGQTAQNPNAYAAIAASGMAELASLPNTVAGWGLAFLQIRKAVGASNVVLGMHISGWTSGKDVIYGSVTDPLQNEVDVGYRFLAPLGLSSNVTGASYDFLVGDPLDRDPDFYRANYGQDRWLDASDNASVSTKSFNRLAEWLRLWNTKTGKRWLLWQVPLGNSNHLNVYNNGAARQGYKGNFPEYFLGTNGRAHLEKFASSGVIGLLFGAGAGGQSSYQNDVFTDGKNYVQSRAGDFLKAGGLAIPTTGTGTTPPPPPPPTGDTAAYNFESSTQGWVSSGAPITGVSSSSAQKFAGSRSLAVQLNGAGTPAVSVANPSAGPGKIVNFRIFLPTNHRISWLQPYVQQGASGNWTWTGNWQAATNLRAGAWNTVAVQVPSNSTGLSSLGVQVATNGSYTGELYIDSVAY